MTGPEKPASNFEKIITSQVGNLDRLELGTGIDKASEKVSEVVGENASENIPQNQQKQAEQNSQSKSHKTQSVTDIPGLVLPTPQKQKKELERIITRRTNYLIKEAVRLQKSKNYSPARLEALVIEIRSLRKVLSELLHATIQRIETLYRQFVWRQ